MVPPPTTHRLARAPEDLPGGADQPVTWRNGDVAVHNIHADDHAFDSGALATGASYTTTFDTPGRHRYLCTIHRQMRGVITVAALGLTGPAAPVVSGGRAVLQVLVPPGTPSVTLERLPGGEPVAQATPDAGGRAAFTLKADVPARYRARAGALTSEPAWVHVAPAVTATVTRSGRRVRVHAAVAPAQAGAGVTLERYVRERFDWVPVRRARLGPDSTAGFTLRASRRLRLRVRLSDPVGGFSRAASGAAVAESRPDHPAHR